jgi:hypothetical protein
LIVKLANLDRSVSLESMLKKQSGQIQNTPSPKSEKVDAKSHPQRGKGAGDFELSPRDRTIDDYGSPPAENFSMPEGLTESDLKNVPIDGDVIGGWDGFCKFLSHRNKSKFALLSICKPRKLDSDILTLVINSSFKIHQEQLSNPINRNFIESMLLEYFKKNIKLSFVSGTGNTSSVVDKSSSTAGTDKTQAAALLNEIPQVKKLYDLLDGEILSQ